MRYQLNPIKVKDYIVGAKKCKLTIENIHTNNYFVYKIKRVKRTDITYQAIFTQDPKDERQWLYIGALFDNGDRFRFSLVKQNRDIIKSFKATIIFEAIIARYINSLKPFRDIAIYHNGYCCMCGKPLTTPESIECGIGPKCLENFRLL
jgi:hypothetical protein